MALLDYGERELSYLSKRDVRMGRLIEETGFLECVIHEDLFHSLAGYIATQQISNKAAVTVRRRIREKFGVMTPKNVAAAADDEVKSVGISMRKANYIKGLAEAVISGELDFEGFSLMGDEEVASKLKKVRGIGDWTAEMFLIFSLGRMDILSYGDFAIRKGMVSLYGLKELNKEVFEKYRKRYSPYGTVASLYLWHNSKKS